MSKNQKPKPSSEDLKKQLSKAEKKIEKLEEQMKKFTSKCDKQIEDFLIFRD